MTESNGGTLSYRVTRLEAEVRELSADIRVKLGSIEADVKTLTLHRARTEPLERMAWIAVGVIVSALAAGAVWAMAAAASGAP